MCVLALLAGWASAHATDLDPAQNLCFVPNFEIHAGDSATISVNLTNTVALNDFGADLYLPQGLELRGAYAATSRTASHQIVGRDRDGFTRIMGFSMAQQAIEPGEGAILTLKVAASDTMQNDTIWLRNISFSVLGDSASHRFNDSFAQVTVTGSVLLGDANGDGAVSIVDATTIANHIMDRPVKSFAARAADANNDGRVSIADASKVIEMLLSSTSNAPARARRHTLAAMPTDRAIALQQGVMGDDGLWHAALSLNSASNTYTALQADVVLPQGIELHDVALASGAASHSLLTSDMGGNVLRVIVFSPQSAPLANGAEVVNLTFSADDGASLELDEALAATTDASEFRLLPATQTTGASLPAASGTQVQVHNGMIAITNPSHLPVRIFTVNGMQVAANCSSYTPDAAGTYLVQVGAETFKVTTR